MSRGKCEAFTYEIRYHQILSTYIFTFFLEISYYIESFLSKTNFNGPRRQEVCQTCFLSPHVTLISLFLLSKQSGKQVDDVKESQNTRRTQQQRQSMNFSCYAMRIRIGQWTFSKVVNLTVQTSVKFITAPLNQDVNINRWQLASIMVS